MPLALVIHDLPNGSAAAKALFDAIYEIAPGHWPVTEGAALVETGVSPTYLRDHLLRALKGRGETAGVLLVSRLGTNAAWANLPSVGEAWLRDTLE